MLRLPPRPTLSWLSVAIISSLWLTALNHLSYQEFSRLIDHDVAGTCYYYLPAIYGLLFLSFAVMTSFKLLFKPYLTLVLLVGGCTYYARSRYGVLFNTEMIENFLETDTAEAAAYVNFSSVSFILLAAVLPALLIWYPKIRYPQRFWRGLGWRLLTIVLALGLAVTLVMMNYKDVVVTIRNNNQLRYELIPHIPLISAGRLMARRIRGQVEEHPHQYYAADAALKSADTKPTIFIFLLGETARAANYAQNGYARKTTPYTDALGDFIFFEDVRACGTSTAVSVPGMFSYKGRREVDLDTAPYEDSLVDFIVHAGYPTYWLDNDSGCKGVCDRLQNYTYYSGNSTAEAMQGRAQCTALNCFDEVMLEDLQQILAQNDGKSQVIFLHLKGSHGPNYFERVPERFVKFTPACPSGDLASCSTEEVVNAYDNSLLYTDYMVAETRRLLEPLGDRFNLGILYVSDHGESLGEDGLYLHGSPYYIAPDYQTRVPMQIWLNDSLYAARHLDRECLIERGKLHDTHSHDQLFHSLLAILNIGSAYYNRELDLFAPCVRGKDVAAKAGQ